MTDMKVFDVTDASQIPSRVGGFRVKPDSKLSQMRALAAIVVETKTGKGMAELSRREANSLVGFFTREKKKGKFEGVDCLSRTVVGDDGEKHLEVYLLPEGMVKGAKKEEDAEPQAEEDVEFED